MYKRMAISVVGLLAGLTLSPVLGAQTAPSNPSKRRRQAAKPDKWNTIPPIKPAYAGKKSAPAPRRDISGVWDAAEADGGRQPSGALEHTALMKPRGQGIEGGQPDETGIMHPLQYTPTVSKRSRPTSLLDQVSDKFPPRFPTIPWTSATRSASRAWNSMN